jgi:DNA-binding transcriptional LysR family regulator
VQPRLKVTLILEDVPFRRSYDFVARGLDLVVRITPLRNASVVEEEIAPVDWVLCASPDYLARAGRPTTPAELAEHAALVHVNTAPQDRIWRLGGPKGEVSVKVNGVFFSNSALALRKAVVAGLGIALVPRYSVATDIAEGALVPLLPRYRVPTRPLLAVYPRATQVPQKVQVFVEFLRGWIATRDINGRG